MDMYIRNMATSLKIITAIAAMDICLKEKENC